MLGALVTCSGGALDHDAEPGINRLFPYPFISNWADDSKPNLLVMRLVLTGTRMEHLGTFLPHGWSASP